MALVDLKDWVKTPEGMAVVGEQTRFCLGGQIWQGFQGSVIRVQEKQLTDDEILTIEDKDGTIDKVLFVRKQRLESRVQRKQDEYDERMSKLRQEELRIRESIRTSKEDGLGEPPFDKQRLSRIHKRMERLSSVPGDESLEIVETMMSGSKEDLVVPTVRCPECDAEAPPGHTNPNAWVHAHKLGKHSKHRRGPKPKKQEEASP